MSNTDSFVSEVSEEVRRDRLFALMRRWGWVAIVIVLGIVGAAGWNEYRSAAATARAQDFGDAILAALDTPEASGRAAALAAISPETPQETAIIELLRAGEAVEADDPAAAAATLRALADAEGLAARYRDLVALKAHMLDPQATPEAMALLDRLARPGAPYRALALEQQAYLDLANGRTEAGIALLRQAMTDAAATPGLQQRAMQLIVALEAGSRLADPGTSPADQ